MVPYPLPFSLSSLYLGRLSDVRGSGWTSDNKTSTTKSSSSPFPSRLFFIPPR